MVLNEWTNKNILNIKNIERTKQKYYRKKENLPLNITFTFFYIKQGFRYQYVIFTNGK